MNSPIEDKLKQIFDDGEKAAKIIENHPGQSFEQIKKSVDLNIASHVSASTHIGLFTYNVLNRKGDLKALADTAAKRIVLSDARIQSAFQNLSAEQKATGSELIYQAIVTDLVAYFENFKGKNVDQSGITEELTHSVMKKIAEILAERK